MKLAPGDTPFQARWGGGTSSPREGAVGSQGYPALPSPGQEAEAKAWRGGGEEGRRRGGRRGGVCGESPRDLHPIIFTSWSSELPRVKLWLESRVGFPWEE